MKGQYNNIFKILKGNKYQPRILYQGKYLSQRDRVEREVEGRIGMGNTCISMADSCQCMTKTTTIL